MIRDAARALARGFLGWGGLVALLAILLVGANRAVVHATLALGITSPAVSEISAFPVRIVLVATMFAAGAACALGALDGRAPSASGIAGSVLRNRAAPIRLAVAYFVAAALGLVMCLVPGVLVLARRFVAIGVMLDEELPGPIAWERSRAIAEGRPVTVVALAAIGFVLRAGINSLWGEAGPWSTANAEDEATWLLLAWVHQALQFVSFAIEGALAAALYRRLSTVDGVDAPTVASVFE